jgi:multiple sugar transport system substrate-binding protein
MVAVYAKQLTDAKLLPLVPTWDGETGTALLDALNAIALTGADRSATLNTLYTTTAGTPAK